jgi:hypothetical protein
MGLIGKITEAWRSMSGGGRDKCTEVPTHDLIYGRREWGITEFHSSPEDCMPSYTDDKTLDLVVYRYVGTRRFTKRTTVTEEETK